MKKNYSRVKVATSIAASVSILLSACGGGAADKVAKVPKDFKPTVTAVNVNFAGTAATGAPLANTLLTAYDAKGKSCGKATSGADGKFLITGKCVFPVLLTSDTPDSLGVSLFAVVPTVDADGATVPVNVTPMTTAISFLVNGTVPSIGASLSSKTISVENLKLAQDKLVELLKPVFIKLSISEIQNFQSGDIRIGTEQDVLLDLISVSYEQVPTLGQKVIRFYFPSENRPVAVVLDSASPSSMRIDKGLGIDPSEIDINRIQKAKSVIPEIAALINDKDANVLSSNADLCFLHNGEEKSNFTDALFDAQNPIDSKAPIAKNFKLIRYNTNTNFSNNTEENVNQQLGDLAYFSFDFVSSRGSLVKTYAWAVRGNQEISSTCSTSGSSWKILGNQRDVYGRTSAYSVHSIMYNSSFSGRVDSYGSGIEFNFYDKSRKFAYVALSGPGLPANGVVFLNADGAFLYSKTNILEVRKAALAAMEEKLVDGQKVTCDSNCLKENAKSLMPKIFDTVVDTRSILLTDKTISEISDAFYGNNYTIRVFEKYEDLDPVRTYTDVLPKRPQFNAEMSPVNFPSLDVNLDQLVIALQDPQAVTANWSLPKDFRGYPLESHKIGFDRKSCIDPMLWPKCTKRSDQYNEFFFSSQYVNPGVTVASPTPYKPTVGKTLVSEIRLFVVDNLNRPIEISIGMDYSK